MPDVSLTSLTAADWVLNAVVVVAAVAVVIVLSRPRFSHSDRWRATVTPLASIVGSGFLIVAPLLGATVGTLAVVAMIAIVALAYAVGGVMRYQIANVEDIVEADDPDDGTQSTLIWMARTSKLVLAAAYVVAVAFYLELLGAFVLRLAGIQDPTNQKIVASALVVLIGGFGIWRGLGILERLEEGAVDTKLGVIAALLIGLAVYNVAQGVGGDWSLPTVSSTWDLTTVRQLLGAFLVVQGFETSRYLRGEYPPEMRIQTMRWAQLSSATIYVVFVGLATVLLGQFQGISETGIIDLSAPVAASLPYLLVIGAVMSQFSAAVADTIGSGGLVEEGTRGRIGKKQTYGAIVVLVLLLLWTTDVLAVIAYASRAFAAYYALQSAMAALHAWNDSSRARSAWYAVVTLIMVLAAVFGIPAESRGG